MTTAALELPPVVLECGSVAWPGAMEQALHALPRRWVFRNERVSALLIGFNRSDSLALGP